MALSPGAILFTSVLTDSDPGTALPSDAFSFIATEAIAAGEVIVFHAPEAAGDVTITYTVGAGGLAALDRVTIQESNQNATLLNDPSGGSVSNVGGSGNAWAVSEFDPIIASSNGDAIAAINMELPWDTDFGVTGLTRANLDNAIANDDPSPVIDQMVLATSNFENAMFAGADYTGIDDPANWVFSTGGDSHTNPNISGTTYATQDADIFLCFAEGTLIQTPAGETAVETLAIGDVITTSGGGRCTVKWLGRQTVHKLFAGPKMQPVRIRAGALGDGLPHSDLTVTADHGMVIDGLVINASALVNGTTIDYLPLDELPDRITYYHIETEAHDAILANGVPAETFIDYLGRQAFDNYQEYLDLYGAERIIREMPQPRISAQRLVPEALKHRLGIVEAGDDFDLDLPA